MSKIALTPNASGSGTFTIASPNSDTDRTLTLPDEAGTVLTSGTRTPFAQWVLASNTSALSSDTTLTDVTVSDSYGITEASGVFTLSESGLYLITFNLTCQGSASERQFGPMIDVNGSTVAQSRDQVSYLDGGTSYGSASVTYTALLNSGDYIRFRAQRTYSDGTLIAYVEQTSGGIVKVGN